MKKLIFGIVLVAVSALAAFGLFWFKEDLRDYGVGQGWLEYAFLIAFLSPLVGLSLIFEVFDRDSLRTGPNGMKLSRMTFSWRAFLYGGVIAFFAVFVGAVWQNKSISAGTLVPFGVLVVFSLLVICCARLSKVMFDDVVLIATTNTLRQKTHLWSEITEIKKGDGQGATLHFRSSGKASISNLYECYAEIIAKAEEALEHARTS